MMDYLTFIVTHIILIHFLNGDFFFLSNDSTDGEPEEKRRKISNVVINQSANDSKVLIDNIPDSSSLIEEVLLKCPKISFEIVYFVILMCQ